MSQRSALGGSGADLRAASRMSCCWARARSKYFPQRAIRQAFATRKVGLEVMDLGAACRTYNILVQEERRVAAALFPADEAEGPTFRGRAAGR